MSRAATAVLCSMPVLVGLALVDRSSLGRASSLWTWLITPRSQRRPHNAKSLLALAVWVQAAPVPIAHLVLRDAAWSRPLRILLALVSIVLQLRIAYTHCFDIELQPATPHESAIAVEYANFGLSIVSLYSSARMLEWALVKRCQLNSARGAWRGGVVRGMEPEGQITVDDGAQAAPGEAKDAEKEVEKKKEEKRKKEKRKKEKKKDDEEDDEEEGDLPSTFPGSRIPLELALCLSFRGLGWAWGLQSPAGRPALVVSEQIQARDGKSASASARLRKRRAITRMLLNGLMLLAILDVCDSSIKSKHLGAPDGPRGGSIWAYRRGPLGGAGPYVISVMFALVVIIPMQIGYNLAIAAHLCMSSADDAAFILCNWHPNLYSRPHTATSLRAFWTTRWHAMFRRSFLFYGYRPVSALSRALGLGRALEAALATLAVFFLSGMLHEVGQEGMAHGRLGHLDAGRYGFGANHFAATRFFLLQGVGCIVESLWDRTEAQTGPLVKGARKRAVLGWLWTFGYLTATSTIMTDVSLRRTLLQQQ